MFVISRCQTPLNPRLGWEGLTPVNKAQKRPPIPLEGHPGCGSSQLSEPCFVTVLLECLHTAKCATPGKVLESGILAAFSASSWVAMGKWTFSDSQIRPQVAHRAVFICHLSWRTFHPLPGSPGPCYPVTPSYFIYKCHTTQPCLAL